MRDEVKHFHEFGLDDRLLKVCNVFKFCRNGWLIVSSSNYAFFCKYLLGDFQTKVVETNADSGIGVELYTITNT